jgi:hypothetical protein
MFAFAWLRFSGWDSSGRKLMMKKAIIAKLERTSFRGKTESYGTVFRFSMSIAVNDSNRDVSPTSPNGAFDKNGRYEFEPPAGATGAHGCVS